MKIVYCHLDFFFFFQAEDGIRDLVRSRGLGDVYKRQVSWMENSGKKYLFLTNASERTPKELHEKLKRLGICLLYTSEAADDLLCVDLGGRRIIKKNKTVLK